MERSALTSVFDERSISRLAHAKRLGNGRRNEAELRNGGQRDEGDAVRELRFGGRGDFKGQTRLANASGPDQGEQADVRAFQQGGERRDLALPPDQRRQRGGERGNREGAPRKRSEGERFRCGAIGGEAAMEAFKRKSRNVRAHDGQS